jgi:hypothetical protein
MAGKTFRCGRPSQRCGRPSQRCGVGQVRGVACTLQGVENAHPLQPHPHPQLIQQQWLPPSLSLTLLSLCRARGQGGPKPFTTEKRAIFFPFIVPCSSLSVAGSILPVLAESVQQRRRQRKAFCKDLHCTVCFVCWHLNRQNYWVYSVKFWNIVPFTASLEMLKDLCWHGVNYIRAILYKIWTNVNISLRRIWPTYCTLIF